MKKRKGSALVWAVVLLAVAMILIASMLFISRQDTRETVFQESRMEAYYVSLSGIEIGYAALMAPFGGSKYIDSFGPSKDNVTHSRDIYDGIKLVGHVEVTIGNTTIDGKRWIQITSVGSIPKSTAQFTNRMRIDPNDLKNIVRDAGE